MCSKREGINKRQGGESPKGGGRGGELGNMMVKSGNKKVRWESSWGKKESKRVMLENSQDW